MSFHREATAGLAIFGSVIKRQTSQTTRDYEWLLVTTSDYEWLQATTSDYEWLRMLQ